MSSIDQQFIEYIVKSLVEKPDAVSVERRIDEKGVLLELTVDPDDLGRVIGKRGATAQSLRTLLRALGTKNDARYNLKIIDNGTGAPSSQQSTSSERPERQADTAESDSQDESVSDDTEMNDTDEQTGDSSDVVSKTRKELEEFDDLDV